MDDEVKRLRAELAEAHLALAAVCYRDGRIRLTRADVLATKGKGLRLTSYRDDATGTVVIEAKPADAAPGPTTDGPTPLHRRAT